MASRTSRDRDASGFTTWLRQAARDGGVVADLMDQLDTAPGAQGRDFTPDELFDYLISVGACEFAYRVVIPAAAASGYPFADGPTSPVTPDPDHAVHPFRPRRIEAPERDVVLHAARASG